MLNKRYDPFRKMVHSLVDLLLDFTAGRLCLVIMLAAQHKTFGQHVGRALINAFWESSGCAQCGAKGKPLPPNGLPYCMACQMGAYEDMPGILQTFDTALNSPASDPQPAVKAS